MPSYDILHAPFGNPAFINFYFIVIYIIKTLELIKFILITKKLIIIVFRIYHKLSGFLL